MSNNIQISPKYGLNPTIPICFFCGQEKNETALLGRLKGDAKAPKTALLDYEPCEACKEKFGDGILILGVTNQPKDNRIPIRENLYPTGQYAVATKDCIIRMVGPEAAAPILKAKRCLLSEPEMTALQEQYEKLMAEKE